MSELGLRQLVDWAVLLDQEERDLRDRELKVGTIEKGVADASPRSLEARLRDVGLQNDATDRLRWTFPAIFQKLSERIGRQDDHPEAMALMGELIAQAHAMGPRLTRLRRRVRDLEMLLVGAVRDLREQTLDGRILRLMAEDRSGLTAIQIHERVEKDHEAIADAMATWRLSTGPSMVLSVREHSTRDEVDQALRRLERTGHSTRQGLPFGTPRWTFGREIGEERLRA